MDRKKRLYMRGIGVGIFITALILIIARKNTPAEVSDAEIISRAHELGMIESDSLSLSNATEAQNSQVQDDASGSNLYPVLVPTGNNADEPDTQSVPDVQADPDTQDEPGTQPDTQIDPDTQSEPDTQVEPGTQPEPDIQVGSGTQPEPDTQSDLDTQSEPDTQPAQTDYVVLQVERGNSSNVVAEKLQRLGVIENAKDFDNYLVNNGYANRISVGTFQIPVGSSYEWIAKKITNSL